MGNPFHSLSAHGGRTLGIAEVTMGTGRGDEAVWSDAEARIRAEIRRVDDVVDDLRAGTADLHWQGPGAGRFRWRTDRRVRELHDQRATLALLLSLVGRAGVAAHIQERRSC